MAWGFVLSEKLPDTMDLTAEIRVEQVSGQRLTDLRRDGPTMKHPVLTGGSCVSVTPADVAVTSNHVIWFTVAAKNEDKALGRINNVLAPAAKLSLSLFASAPVALDLRRMGPVDENGRIAPSSAWSEVQLRLQIPHEMSAPEIDESARLADWLCRDSWGLDIARLYCAAQDLDVIATDDDGHSAALLRYFHVIEAVTSAVTGRHSREPATNDERRVEVIEQLRKNLQTGGTVSQLTKVVQNASRKLDQINEKFLGLRIEAASDFLGLAAADKDAALSLKRIRDRRLSHPKLDLVPGRPALPHEMSSARAAAQSFIRAYLRQSMPARHRSPASAVAPRHGAE